VPFVVSLAESMPKRRLGSSSSSTGLAGHPGDPQSHVAAPLRLLEQNEQTFGRFPKAILNRRHTFAQAQAGVRFNIFSNQRIAMMERQFLDQLKLVEWGRRNQRRSRPAASTTGMSIHCALQFRVASGDLAELASRHSAARAAAGATLTG
jgi:hypothetical protein